jgi:hypothetical protein
MNDLREFAVWALGHWREEADKPGLAVEPFNSGALNIARKELFAAGLLLELPPSAPEYEYAPAVAMECITRAAMMIGAAWGERMTPDTASDAGRSGARDRWSRDPSQAIRAEVMAWWNGGRVIGPEIPSGAAFDRAACEKYPQITGEKTVYNWRNPPTRKSRKKQG